MKRLLPFFLACLASPLFAQDYKYRFTLRDDNDFYFAGADRYYTNGTFFGLSWAARQKKPGEKGIWNIEFGQKMYNPQSGFIPDPKYIDRPFAAYLYLGAAHTKIYADESRLRVSLQGGVIGPDALGKEMQSFIHRLIGQYPPRGWAYQIGNQVAVNAQADYSRLLVRSQSNTIDISAEGSGLLGTTFSGATAGLLFRAGALKSFEKSSSYGADVGNGSSERELFFYTRPQAGWVAYDATLEGLPFGNNASNSVTVAPNRFYYSQSFGFVYAKNRWLVDFSMLLRTREAPTQVRTVHWGMLSLGYRFGKSAQ
ncbi:MAG: lipid A deacylase LpxR family protein [Mucilaginibacter polytrichastri]|nr:lipid A deacylase LpxR family protein [Mucilaginibacter polytrichastri]